MTYQEPERLALELNALIERRMALRAILNQRLRNLLTDQERADIDRVVAIIDREIADLEKRLAELKRPGSS